MLTEEEFEKLSIDEKREVLQKMLDKISKKLSWTIVISQKEYLEKLADALKP